MTDPRINEIQARVDAVTAGPWNLDRSTGQWELWDRFDDELIFGDTGDGYQGPKRADAEFIGYARSDIPFLLARLAEAEGRIATALDLAKHNTLATPPAVLAALSASPEPEEGK